MGRSSVLFVTEKRIDNYSPIFAVIDQVSRDFIDKEGCTHTHLTASSYAKICISPNLNPSLEIFTSGPKRPIRQILSNMRNIKTSAKFRSSRESKSVITYEPTSIFIGQCISSVLESYLANEIAFSNKIFSSRPVLD